MKSFVEVLLFLCAGFWGLFFGALLTEAMVMIPMWRALTPLEFFARHAEHGKLLYAYFAPVTALTCSFAILGSAMTLLANHPSKMLSGIAAALSLLLLLIYFLYFRSANADLSSAQLPSEQLSLSLQLWSNWHWFRTVIAAFGFALSLLALRQKRF
jgi:Domain of unknown function (DUF1772)